MIYRSRNVFRLHQDLVQRLELAHGDLTRIVAVLRDPAVEVWTGAPPVEPLDVPRNSASGWVGHFTNERQRLLQLRDAGVGPILTRLYPELVDPLAGYAATIPVIVAAIQVAIDRHTVNEQLTAVERAALADTLEAELE